MTRTGLKLDWSESTDNRRVEYYEVYRDGKLVSLRLLPSFTDSDLSAGTTYTYTVTAIDAARNRSAASAPLEVTTDEAPDTEAPTPPDPLGASNVNHNGATISWTASTDNVGVDHYEVYRGDKLVAETTELTFRDNFALNPSKAHWYQVDAVNAAGNRASSKWHPVLGKWTGTVSCSRDNFIGEAKMEFNDNYLAITEYRITRINGQKGGDKANVNLIVDQNYYSPDAMIQDGQWHKYWGSVLKSPTRGDAVQFIFDQSGWDVDCHAYIADIVLD